MLNVETYLARLTETKTAVASILADLLDECGGWDYTAAAVAREVNHHMQYGKLTNCEGHDVHVAVLSLERERHTGGFRRQRVEAYFWELQTLKLCR